VQLPHLAAPDAPVTTLSFNPFLRAGNDRCALRSGVYGLGGRAADAVPLTALATEPRAASLTVSDGGVVTLQRITAAIVVRVDDETIGVGPVELRNGARIEFGNCRLVFETDACVSTDPMNRTGERSARATTEGPRVLSLSSPVRTRTGASTQTSRAASTDAGTSAALVSVRSGTRHPLPQRRLLIGRDDSCDVVVRGSSVSRRHASIVPVAGGFMLRDESANGTLVNGVRVVGTYLLGSGDVVRVQDEELRVELDSSAPVAKPRGEMTTQLDLSHITKGVTEEQARAAAHRQVTASLEIIRGPFAGACFQVERAVCSIGRGEENDVRIRDDTVSLTHATLLLKRGSWFVVDLRSMNGTFVDGSRVSGERELHAGARVRLGAVELVFRSIESAPAAPGAPPRPSLWARFKSVLRGVAPPS
jgi:pSer/pThr/pTyr-binding forkhead associated (FHA) protein